jgi:hypothetical protein
MVLTPSIYKCQKDVEILHGETVRVLWQNIKMLPGDEMQNNGSKMLKK